MEIQVADQRILLFPQSVSPSEAEEKARGKKLDAFGTITKVTSFLSRPKDEEFDLTYRELRYEPFWHVVAKAHYVYDRNANYQVAVSGAEVMSVTLKGEKHDTVNGHIHTSVVEHCVQEEEEVVIVDGITGEKRPDLSRYLKLSAKQVKGDLGKEVGKDAIFVPPQSRVSAIMRDALSKMIRGIQADKIFEEKVEVSCVDLYYHPVYAYKYLWKPKGKDAIVTVDGVTGEVSAGTRTFQEYLGKVLDRDFLFDIGADAAGMLIPGGSIAVKAAKKYIDTKKTGK